MSTDKPIHVDLDDLDDDVQGAGNGRARRATDVRTFAYRLFALSYATRMQLYRELRLLTDEELRSARQDSELLKLALDRVRGMDAWPRLRAALDKAAVDG